MAVVAVVGDDVVLVAQGVDRPHRAGFLPDVQVQKAADVPAPVHLPRHVLELADEHHLPIEKQALFPFHAPSLIDSAPARNGAESALVQGSVQKGRGM